MAKLKLVGRKRKLNMKQVYNHKPAFDPELQRMATQIELAIPDEVERERYIRQAMAALQEEIRKYAAPDSFEKPLIGDEK